MVTSDGNRAIALVESVIRGDLEVREPPHWLIEVGAVLARLSPETAVETGQHLFDTLYHAVALEHASATLITADDRYLTKAASLGRIVARHIDNERLHGRFTPFQPDLYAQRAERWIGLEAYGDYEDYEAVLVAPAAFLERYPEACRKFGCSVSHEAIAPYLPLFARA